MGRQDTLAQHDSIGATMNGTEQNMYRNDEQNRTEQNTRGINEQNRTNGGSMNRTEQMGRYAGLEERHKGPEQRNSLTFNQQLPNVSMFCFPSSQYPTTGLDRPLGVATLGYMSHMS